MAHPRFPTMQVAMTFVDWGTVYVGNDDPITEGLIADWNPREIAVYKELPDNRDLLEDIARPRFIASPTLRVLLTDLVPGRVQYLPIRLQSIDGEREYPGFSIIHVLQEWSLREAAEKAQEYDLFTMPYPVGELRTTVALKDAIIDAGIRGMEFVDQP